ncbi:MAG TPA: acetylornithine deacetylase [Gammaproteobacteria bacterium]|nr:acetylornithine deacetylase [Gammaproteobacteria bacterium]
MSTNPGRSLEMITKLVGYDTVSRHSNLDLVDFISEYLRGFGIKSHLVYNDTGTKANIFATVGPPSEHGVLLSGHLDVVPVDGQAWNSNPFKVVSHNRRLYGRGTADMKSFIALALARVPDMLAARLKQPIHFGFSYDEEIGCLGAPSMIAAIQQQLPAIDAVIVGEPTSMQVVKAHKGICVFHTCVHGHEAHSSQMDRGVSAVMTAARLVNWIRDQGLHNAVTALPNSLFSPPATTLHVGIIKGGTAVNIISGDCEFQWDLRNIPEDDPQSMLRLFNDYCEQTIVPDMRLVGQDCSITTAQQAAAPAMRAEPHGRAEALCQRLLGCHDSTAVSYATEGGQFQKAGYSTIVCGPGSIDQAHQADEYVELSQIEKAEVFLSRLIHQQIHQ